MWQQTRRRKATSGGGYALCHRSFQDWERQAYDELLKIELKCDAFAAITLAAIGRNPLAMARSHEAFARDYPDYARAPTCRWRPCASR